MYTRLNTAQAPPTYNQATQPTDITVVTNPYSYDCYGNPIANGDCSLVGQSFGATRTTQMSLPWACLRIVSWLVLQPTASAIQSAIRPRIDGPRTAIPETAGSRKHRAKTCTLSLFICRTFFKSFQTWIQVCSYTSYFSVRKWRPIEHALQSVRWCFIGKPLWRDELWSLQEFLPSQCPR